jgi:phosphatidate cytidylyltransferase
VGELRKRVVTGICLAPVVVLLFFFLPLQWFFIFLLIIALLGISELAVMVKAGPRYLLLFLALAGAVPLYFGATGLYPPALLLLAVVYMLVRIFLGEGKRETANSDIFLGITVLIFGGIFIMLPLFYIYKLKEISNILPLIFLFALWASDTSAYFVGKTFGRTPLAPRISPKKTVEGLLGAVIGSMIIIVASHTSIGITFRESLITGCVMGLLGQLGDILESLGKRLSETKDSSSLIPGHGGILDRIDSFIFTAPFLYYYLAGIR